MSNRHRNRRYRQEHEADEINWQEERDYALMEEISAMNGGAPTSDADRIAALESHCTALKNQCGVADAVIAAQDTQIKGQNDLIEAQDNLIKIQKEALAERCFAWVTAGLAFSFGALMMFLVRVWWVAA